MKCPKIEKMKMLSNLTISDAKTIETWKVDDFLQKLKKVVHIVFY